MTKVNVVHSGEKQEYVSQSCKNMIKYYDDKHIS